MGDVAVLLGAGASRDAGLPTTGEMTKCLAEHFDSHRSQPTREVLHFVTGMLLGSEGEQGNNPFAGLDVERVMTAIDLLGDRQHLELAPFIFSWHPRVAALEAPKRQIGSWQGDKLRRGLNSRRNQDLEKALRDFVLETVGIGPNDGGVFKLAYVHLTDALVDILAKLGDTSYLRPIFDLCPDDGWLAVATLNYDLALESAARNASVPLSTGVETWIDTGDWRWPAHGLRLLKVHGSINWRNERRSEIDTMKQYRITAVDPSHKVVSPAVIFGGRNKLRTDGPFLELLAQFELMLREAQALLVVGYSFRDDHVNDIIRRWINRSERSRIVVVEPNWDATSSYSGQSFQRELRRALSGHDEIPGTMAAEGRPGRETTPAKPARLSAITEIAKLGLPKAVDIAAALEQAWPPRY